MTFRMFLLAGHRKETLDGTKLRLERNCVIANKRDALELSLKRDLLYNLFAISESPCSVHMNSVIHETN